HLSSICFSPILPRHPRYTLFPYTTLFRSVVDLAGRQGLDLQPAQGRQVGLQEQGLQRPGGHRQGLRVDLEAQPRPRDEVPLLLRSEEHTSELQSQSNLVCRLLLEKKKKTK